MASSCLSWIGCCGGRRLLFLPMVAAAVLVGAAAAPASSSACYTRVFSFGDSLADTGNYRFVFGDDNCYADRFPYGETFFHRATGRYSDGRIVLDFIADALGLPFVPPYLSLSGQRAEDFVHGANFAVAGATALPPDFFRDRGIDLDAAHLDMELKWFRDLLNILCPGDLAGCSDTMNQSLFMVGEIGGNDYNKPLFKRIPLETVVTFVPAVIAKISSAITELIGIGAKALVVPGDFPIGCLPRSLMTFEGDKEVDYEPGTGCIRQLNEFARYHNKLLIEELEKLRKLHPNVTIIYADYYGAYMDIFTSPHEHGSGIKYPLVACCGGEGRYGVSPNVTCGHEKYNLCDNPKAYGSWDGVHLPEIVYRAIARSLLRGSHTQPPLATTIASSCIKLNKLSLSVDEYKSL